MNRHNPFALLYDDDTDSWNSVYLLPIMTE